MYLCIYIHTAQEIIFSSFPICSEKMVVPKKSHWNVIFLVLSGKMIFLFPEKMISFFRRKVKDISQKNTWEYYSLKKLVPPK